MRAIEKNALCFFLQNEGEKKNLVDFLNKSFTFFQGEY